MGSPTLQAGWGPTDARRHRKGTLVAPSTPCPGRQGLTVAPRSQRGQTTRQLLSCNEEARGLMLITLFGSRGPWPAFTPSPPNPVNPQVPCCARTVPSRAGGGCAERLRFM